MSTSDKHGGPCQNTDRELWREREGDYYADSIHVTEGGGIGINVGGNVHVKPLRAWHALAEAEPLPAAESAAAELKKLTNSDDWNNATEWNGDISGMRRRLTWLLELAERNAAQLDSLRTAPRSADLSTEDFQEWWERQDETFHEYQDKGHARQVWDAATRAAPSSALAPESGFPCPTCGSDFGPSADVRFIDAADMWSEEKMLVLDVMDELDAMRRGIAVTYGVGQDPLNELRRWLPKRAQLQAGNEIRAKVRQKLAQAAPVAPNSATSPSNSERARHIEGFRSLNANWDSYGAEKLPEETIQLALRVSAMLGDEWKVIPCADGPSAWFVLGNEDEVIKVWASAERRDANG